MKKLYILAALLMAPTSAHAGGGVTFQINGERIHVEAPRHCNALSCIKITAPGYSGSIGDIDLKGFGSKSKDDDVADTTPAKPTPAPAPAPVQAATPAPAAPVATAAPSTAVATAAPAPLPLSTRPSPLRRRLSSRLFPLRPRLPRRLRRRRPPRSASGPPKRTRATCASRNAAATSAATP